MRLTLPATHLSGIPGLKPGRGVSLRIDDDQIAVRRGHKQLAHIAWSDVADLHIDKAPRNTRHVTATRILAVGIFAPLIKKRRRHAEAFLTITSRRGGRVAFRVTRGARRLERRLGQRQTTLVAAHVG